MTPHVPLYKDFVTSSYPKSRKSDAINRVLALNRVFTRLITFTEGSVDPASYTRTSDFPLEDHAMHEKFEEWLFTKHPHLRPPAPVDGAPQPLAADGGAPVELVVAVVSAPPGPKVAVTTADGGAPPEHKVAVDPEIEALEEQLKQEERAALLAEMQARKAAAKMRKEVAIAKMEEAEQAAVAAKAASHCCRAHCACSRCIATLDCYNGMLQWPSCFRNSWQ